MTVESPTIIFALYYSGCIIISGVHQGVIQQYKGRFRCTGPPRYTVCVSPDGSLCASGGKDATAMLWDVTDGKHLYSLDAGATINMMSFSPKNYWLVAVTDQAIKVWDLENKAVLEEITPVEKVKGGLPWCVSLCWSAYGNTLFCGSTDGQIFVYEVVA